MRVISLTQPWASAVLLLDVQVINLPRPVSLPRHEMVLIHADTSRRLCPPIPRYLLGNYKNDLSEERGVILGAVTAGSCGHIDDCDVRGMGVVGPYCLTVYHPRIFHHPPEVGRLPKLHLPYSLENALDAETAALVQIAAKDGLMTPYEWSAARSDPDAYNPMIHPKRPDGWVGD